MSRKRIGAAAAAILGSFAVFACSASTTVSTAPCDPSKCAAGNECIAVGTETKCRLTCNNHSECPTNYKCQTGSAKSYCAADTLQIKAKDKGQWAYACNPQQGVDNADCDGEQGFKCLAKSPTDGSAYCTRYDCTKDTDCRAGWYCGEVRTSPSASTTDVSWGTETRVCLPDTFCAPCAADFDCSQKNGPAYCVAGSDGAKFCASECGSNNDCERWADCKAAPAPSDKTVCTPRAGSCTGDGQLCAPCRSDGDCKAGGGVCLQSNLGTNEQFCSGVSASDCKVVNSKLEHGCTAPAQGNTATFGCMTSKTNPDAPYNACYGYVKFGKDSNDYTMGCWTRPYSTSTVPDAGVKDAAKVDSAVVDASAPDASVQDAAAD